MSTRGVVAHEVDKFRRLQRSWWDPTGPLRTLHDLNPVRVRYIADSLLRTGTAAAGTTSTAPRSVLGGRAILDVGCGGGVLSEQLARVGANVTGIDVCDESLQVAAARLKDQPSLKDRLNYKNTSLFDVTEKFDVVVASEVMEHVDDPAAFLQHLCGLVNDNGALVITTINKTVFSGAVYVGAAEYLTGMVPAGTHDWTKFLPHEDITLNAMKNQVMCMDVSGVIPVPNITASALQLTPVMDYQLTKNMLGGHYFWSGVRTARAAPPAAETVSETSPAHGDAKTEAPSEK